jgi:alanine-glyoxylate transaminase/serine-glyoxylate transaminase/serine-pyruvate transaminase
MSGRDFIQLPGPTNIPDRVLEAYRRPIVDFGGPKFREILDDVFERLPAVFSGSPHVVSYISNGHGAWEGTLRNIVRPGEKLLLADTGMFSGRWGDMVEGLGFKLQTTPARIREGADVEAVRDALGADADHEIKALLIAHTETSTGVRTDLAPLRAALDEFDHPALIVVDAIASLGTEVLPVRELGLDVVISASQKGLMMPPGLSFAAVSDRALEIAQEIHEEGSYWAWPSRLDVSAPYRRYGGTPPEQAVFAMQVALDMIDEEGGVEGVIARHERLADAARAAFTVWSEGGALEFNAIHKDERANAVTALRLADGIDGELLRAMCRDRFSVTIGGGMLDMADGRGIRIGHLGDLNEPMILGALAGVETAMRVLGIPLGAGALDAAMASLASS